MVTSTRSDSLASLAMNRELRCFGWNTSNRPRDFEIGHVSRAVFTADLTGSNPRWWSDDGDAEEPNFFRLADDPEGGQTSQYTRLSFLIGIECEAKIHLIRPR